MKRKIVTSWVLDSKFRGTNLDGCFWRWDLLRLVVKVTSNLDPSINNDPLLLSWPDDLSCYLRGSGLVFPRPLEWFKEVIRSQGWKMFMIKFERKERNFEPRKEERCLNIDQSNDLRG